jgi:hypothetical protein
VQKELAASLRARKTLLEYEEFATRRSERKLEIRFAENDYTRSVREGDGGENA